MTGFTYGTSFFSNVSHYASTNWSIWNADPKASFAGGPIFSGTDAGTTAAAGDSTITVTVAGLNIALPAGTYWLGTQDNVDDGSITVYGVSTTGGGNPAEQSDNAGTFHNPQIAEAAFTINGHLPVPATLPLLGIGLMGLLLSRRNRSA